MQIIQGTTQFQLNNDTAVAMGKFDGVHVGHRKLLQQILNKKKTGLMACVFTFDPAPAVLFGYSDPKELSTREEKRILFEKMGVDVLIEFPLTKETAAIPPEQFVREFLCERMRACYIAAGEDVSFGNCGRGNAELLQKLCRELHYELDVIEKVCVEGDAVSSTRIRTLLEAGQMEDVERLLGSPYSLSGVVEDGRKIGRTIGFPTVNLYPQAQKLLPPNGVYFSKVLLEGKTYDAISNVGCKPTVTDVKVMGVETYLYDFDREIYGETIEVELYDFVRPESKFEGLDGLKAQLQKDIETGRKWHLQRNQKEQFSRAELLLGSDALKYLQRATVAVFGVGGVGGYVVEALARTGIGRFVLIDNDQVSLSNLNRQIIATRDSVGRDKVDVMAERIHSINPEAEVELHKCFYLPEKAGEFDFSQYSYVVDAVDTVTAKLDIILRAKEAGVPVISAMGTGNKLDPARFRVADIYETSGCPLAKVMRRELKKRNVDALKVVYSTEEAIRTGQRTPGSVAFVPSVAGLIMAGEVIKDLISSNS